MFRQVTFSNFHPLDSIISLVGTPCKLVAGIDRVLGHKAPNDIVELNENKEYVHICVCCSIINLMLNLI